VLREYYDSYPAELAADTQSSRHRGRRRSIYPAVKRGFDIVATLILAPFALFVTSLLALVIRLDGGSAFYSQPRLGRDGRIFKLWKIRTMVPNADQRLVEFLSKNPAARIEWDRTQKLSNDPRITRLGSYLRKYSLDELPQLFNVLRGDMSLVGPRPMMPDQRQHYPETAYFNMRPGLTGLWQVNARNGCSFAERARHDTQYALTMSFATDIRILLMTPTVVLRGTGM
jgi:lipopolysaccharide/colanic/teichoic acid biosynthesis glycosyltransferase